MKNWKRLQLKKRTLCKRFRRQQLLFTWLLSLSLASEVSRAAERATDATDTTANIFLHNVFLCAFLRKMSSVSRPFRVGRMWAGAMPGGGNLVRVERYKRKARTPRSAHARYYYSRSLVLETPWKNGAARTRWDLDGRNTFRNFLFSRYVRFSKPNRYNIIFTKQV